jgi:hypothetical protein
MKRVFAFVLVLCALASSAFAQSGVRQSSTPDAKEEATATASTVDTKPRLSVDMLGGYITDYAQASLGFEKQGRMAYVILRAEGNISQNFSYKLEVNPINESRPLPACGEEGYFFPNVPGNIGPNVSCSTDGRLRVDDYRFLALDPVAQQGPIRQAYLQYAKGPATFKAGRFLLPLGLSYDEVGSFTAKDATHIQRINTEGAFGFSVGLTKKAHDGRSLASFTGATFTGDTRFRDYSYFYFLDGSLDANSGLNSVLSGTFSPMANLEFRGAWKYGFSGSKVERLPNFYASKRNDMAGLFAMKYSPHRYVTVFGEYAHYRWGLMKSSAELLGRQDTSPVDKPGYYIGTTVQYPIRRNYRVGATVTREELRRDDSLIRYLAEEGMYHVTLGKKERSLTTRVFVTVHDRVTVAWFRNSYSNPFPWVSGSAPIEGDWAFRDRGQGNDKGGLVIKFTHVLR